MQAVICQVYFVELNHPFYSPDIAPSDYYMFLHLNRFIRGKRFGSDHEVITIVEDYLDNLNSGLLLME